MDTLTINKPIFTKQCVLCGKIMKNVHSQRDYCDECRKIVNQEKNEIRRVKEKNKRCGFGNDLHEVANIASSVGLSYGKLQIKAMLAGVSAPEYAKMIVQGVAK